MKLATRFNVHPGWKILIADLGIKPADVLALAGLPADLFSREGATLSVGDYFDFWRGFEAAAGDVELPLKIAQVISVEVFDPPIFASLCSPNLNVALLRLSHFKPLIAPMTLTVEINETRTTATIERYTHDGPLPRSLGNSELVFFTKLARMGTRYEMTPTEVVCQRPPKDLSGYRDFFGTRLQTGDVNRISFAAKDAQRPFLTENMGMWEFFEPELKKRLSDLEMGATMCERVRSALLEMLPGGQSSVEEAASRMAISKRTLQRRLSQEGMNFQAVLNATREELARHYLSHSFISPGEISFLLGFRDANSFLRAFKSWTGQTPGEFRDRFKVQSAKLSPQV